MYEGTKGEPRNGPPETKASRNPKVPKGYLVPILPNPVYLGGQLKEPVGKNFKPGNLALRPLNFLDPYQYNPSLGFHNPP